jgi:DoxX-like protein
MWKSVTRSTAPRAVILIRLLVGAVFLSEGIQKFLFPDQLGAGRFVKIGLPMPELLGPFVGTFEILCGSLVLLGLLTRWRSSRFSSSWRSRWRPRSGRCSPRKASGPWRTNPAPTGR